MKLKKQVIFDKDTMTLKNEKNQKAIPAEDMYIFRALQIIVFDDEQLINLVMRTEQLDEIEAGFRLAGFVEEYGDYLEEEQIGIMPYRSDKNTK